MRFSDEYIIKVVKERGDKLNVCFEYLYSQLWDKVRKQILAKGGNEEDARDIFHEAIIAWYEAVKNNNYEYKAKISTYLYTVVNNMWINKSKKDRFSVILDNDWDTENNEMALEDKMILSERDKMVNFYIDKLRDDCKKVLTYFYYDKLDMTRIAQLMGYKNEQIARNKKMKCFKAFSVLIKKNSELKAF